MIIVDVIVNSCQYSHCTTCLPPFLCRYLTDLANPMKPHFLFISSTMPNIFCFRYQQFDHLSFIYKISWDTVCFNFEPIGFYIFKWLQKSVGKCIICFYNIHFNLKHMFIIISIGNNVLYFRHTVGLNSKK